MGLTHGDQSAVMSVNRGEMAIIIWMTPQSAFPLNQNPESDSDGLRIYDMNAAQQLFAHGVSVYPSVHSDFLSKSGSLDIRIEQRCNAAENSALVPRLTNRMVIVKERMPFMFTAPSGKDIINSRTKADSDTSARAYDVGNSDFEKNNMIAFVVVVSSV